MFNISLLYAEIRFSDLGESCLARWIDAINGLAPCPAARKAALQTACPETVYLLIQELPVSVFEVQLVLRT